ncbi:MAG: hypothetical protein HYY03_00240 [Chloroflexi bacterium]|nr:hypothetical protein [Chloroflexota bacterium]
MSQPKIEPHRITKAIQLPGFWLASLVALVVAFIVGALNTEELWLKVIFGIAAVGVIPPVGLAVFLLQTKYRPELQDDPYYLEYKRRQETEFATFQPENVRSNQPSAIAQEKDRSWEELETERISRYQRSYGLFLVHAWRPSQTPGQVADIVISLHQHNAGPLTEGKVKYVEYHLGPKFFDYPVIKTDPRDNFSFDVSAYAPMLCLARIHFTDSRPPVELERYVDFEQRLH